MQALLIPALMLASVLVPTKSWYRPTESIVIRVEFDQPVTLVMTDFTGKTVSPADDADVVIEPGTGGEIKLDVLFPMLRNPGTYVLYAVPGEALLNEFVGTPLVIGVREDDRIGAPDGPIAVEVVPMRYAVMQTEAGEITLAFYYDAAPNTVRNFLTLSENGFYDGLTFHRIVPSFVIQGGDPLGNGAGGPGYQIDAEFSDKQHLPGVISMARSGDPNERSGAMPRGEFANSAGSQFFICLDYGKTKNLDRKYTAFGIVTEGMDVVEKIAQTPLADAQSGRPEKPPVIQKVDVRAVTKDNNPYDRLLGLSRAATQPAYVPAGE
jgi:peptidyl-prolyl cis-trans isomerase B (cyclophilin B)